jgi:hypothetical protein
VLITALGTQPAGGQATQRGAPASRAPRPQGGVL